MAFCAHSDLLSDAGTSLNPEPHSGLTVYNIASELSQHNNSFVSNALSVENIMKDHQILKFTKNTVLGALNIAYFTLQPALHIFRNTQ